MRNNYHNPSHSEDSVTKISRSKSRNQMNIASKIKQKESGWNDRFHLQHIPEYNYQNEPHSQYLKNKLRIPNKKNDRNDLSKAKRVNQPSLQKNKVSNKPNMRRNEERQKQAINKAFADLKELWYQKCIPECHMEIMTKIFNREVYPMKILDDIKHEFSEITKQTSLIQKVMSSIESREACLQKIFDIIKQWESEQLNIAKVNKFFEERINHLRILSVHCIECIYQWKQSIEPELPKNYKLKYTVNGKSYLARIVEDCKSIVASKLSTIYAFDTKKQDVFFLNYMFDGKKMSVVSKNILKRIRLCEMLLNEDEDGGQQEENKQRTPMIQQKNKSPINRPQKSLPPKGIMSSIQKWKKLQIQYAQFSQYFSSSLAKSVCSQSFLTQIQILKYEELTIFQNSQTNEQVVLGVDRNSSARKIIVLSIKANNIETIGSTLKSLCQYLWEHDNCTQIRMSLVHHQIGQNLAVDPELEKRIKQIGFRWVSVNRAAADMRMTIYSIKRPLNTIAHKTARRKQAYPVVVEHACILSLNENIEKKIPNKCPAAIYSLIDLLRQLKKPEYQQICKRDQFSHHLDSMKKIEAFLLEQNKKNNQQGQTTFSYSGLKAFEIQSKQTAGKVFKNVQISEQRINGDYPQYLSLINTSFKFRHPTIVHEKYTKFIPTKDTQILICQSNYPIYLLQSDEEMINFFIIEVEQTFSMDSIDTIFHAMGQQSSFLDDFWLPIFHKMMDYSDECGLKNTEIVSTDYWSCLSSLKRKGNKKRTKIIKPPFVFGMIHKKLLEILEIPFYCTLVRKEDLI